MKKYVKNKFKSNQVRGLGFTRRAWGSNAILASTNIITNIWNVINTWQLGTYANLVRIFKYLFIIYKQTQYSYVLGTIN